ncbi:unnamed protein product [Mytilus coruscus]|uniref:Chromo domain-containing protein n=1 Tax=Mytilus coruscus TaxID=42192 RepID=A0A6J7ZU38_MYTCO|nr:unnamed protein product [Mytilus coruscus]
MDPTKILAKFKGDFTENPSQNAQIWFNGLPEDVTDTRENLKCEFLKKYQISHGQNFQKLSDFIDLKQQETESVAEYINRVNALSEDQDVGQFKLTELQYKCKPELVRLMSLGKWPETVEEAEVRLRSVEANFQYLEKCEKKETEDKIISELKPKIDMMFQQISAVNSKSLQQPTASPTMVEPLLDDRKAKVQHRTRTPRRQRRRNPCYRCGASGASLRAVGQIHVTIEIGCLSMEQTFQVFENFTHSVILGLDFLDQQKARLNFDDKTLVLQSGITEVPLTNGENNDNSICFISLINDEVIPSRSEVIIPVQTVDKSIKSKIEQKQKLMVMLGTNRDVFAINLSELGCTDLHPHRIDTGDAAPVRQRFYRQSPAMKTESSKHIKEMLDNNIIEPSQSEWASPVCLGTANGNADALSRRPYGTEIVTITTATVESSTQTEATFIELDPYASICEIITSPKEKVVNDQRTDENFKDVIKYILDKELPDKTRQARKTVIESQDYILDDDYHDPQDRPTNNVDVPTDDEMSDGEDNEEENARDAEKIVQTDTQPENQVQRHTNDDRNNDDSDLYLVERIVKAKRINNKMHYYIKWLGFGNRSNSWEPEENIPPELRHEFKVRMDQTKRIKARITKR